MHFLLLYFYSCYVQKRLSCCSIYRFRNDNVLLFHSTPLFYETCPVVYNCICFIAYGSFFTHTYHYMNSNKLVRFV